MTKYITAKSITACGEVQTQVEVVNVVKIPIPESVQQQMAMGLEHPAPCPWLIFKVTFNHPKHSMIP